MLRKYSSVPKLSRRVPRAERSWELARALARVLKKENKRDRAHERAQGGRMQRALSLSHTLYGVVMHVYIFRLAQSSLTHMPVVLTWWHGADSWTMSRGHWPEPHTKTQPCNYGFYSIGESENFSLIVPLCLLQIGENRAQASWGTSASAVSSNFKCWA